MLISNHNSFRVLFDKIYGSSFANSTWKLLWFEINKNYCVIYKDFRHTFVPYWRRWPSTQRFRAKMHQLANPGWACKRVQTPQGTYCSAHTHTHTRLTALFPGLPRWASTTKAKPIWTLLKQETVSGSGISWTICKSAPSSREITMPAPHHSAYRPDALPATQPTAK